MKTDREKLIDLIYESGQLGVFASYDSEMRMCERFADYLISKGVTIPVRCVDCKRCFEKRTKRNNQLMRFCMRMDGNEFQVNANDFCSYGERKEE